MFIHSTPERKSLATTVAFLVVFVLVSSFLWGDFRSYAKSYVWHIEHGSQTSLYGHRLTLPKCWWNEFTNPQLTLLTRASVPSLAIGAGIIVRAANPEERFRSDQDLLKAQQLNISSTNAISAMTSTKSSLRTPMSSLLIHTVNFPLRCMRSSLVPLDVTLICNAANFDYVFRYEGPPEREQEVEQIPSSLK